MLDRLADAKAKREIDRLDVATPGCRRLRWLILRLDIRPHDHGWPGHLEMPHRHGSAMPYFNKVRAAARVQRDGEEPYSGSHATGRGADVGLAQVARMRQQHHIAST